MTHIPGDLYLKTTLYIEKHLHRQNENVRSKKDLFSDKIKQTALIVTVALRMYFFFDITVRA